MPNQAFLIDLQRGENFGRFIGQSLADLRRLLAEEGIEQDLSFLRVERVDVTAAAQTASMGS